MFRQIGERMRTRSFRAVIIVLAAIGLTWGWRKWTEPRYHGRGVRSWIEQLPYDSGGNSETEQALRSFGNDAVPYLIEAMTRNGKWEKGLLTKIPSDYLSYFVDLDHCRQVRLHAIGKLEELAVNEALENELQLDPKSPVLDQIVPVWRRGIQQNSLWVFGSLYSLAPLLTNVAPMLRQAAEEWNPERTPYWFAVSSVLAETHDRTLVPIFLRAVSPTNSFPTRERGFRLIGRNGFSDESVESALRNALASTNGHFRSSAVACCAYLNVCTREALAAVAEREHFEFERGPSEIANVEIFEPIIRWRADTNDWQSAQRIERNLGPGAKYAYRLQTAEVIGKIGRAARQFSPIFVRIAREEGPPFQTDALRALKSIDPAEARKVLASLPPRKVLHATAGVSQ